MINSSLGFPLQGDGGKGGGDVTEGDGGPEVNEPHRVATAKILACSAAKPEFWCAMKESNNAAPLKISK